MERAIELDWRDAKLGQEITLKRGYDLPLNQRVPGPYPIVTSSGIADYHNEFKAKGPGVVTGRTGTLGEVFYIYEDFWPHNTALYVQDFKGNDPRFIFYLLQTLGFELRSAAAAVPTVNRNYLHLLRVRVPSRTTQERIGSLLSAYDNLIDLNRGRIQLLNEMSRAIFQEWFVHFRFPGYQKVQLIESELGKIPEGWEIKELRETVHVHRGKSYRSKNLVNDGGLPFLNLKCIERDGGFRIDGVKRYDGPFKEHQLADEGDIVVALTDMTQARRVVARAARVPRMKEKPCVVSMDLARIVPLDTTVTEYFYGMLRYSRFPNVLKEYASGVNVLHLSPDHISNFKFGSPPVALQKKFSEIAQRLHLLEDNLSMQIDVLNEIRNRLLPKLVSGDLDISDLEFGTEESNHQTPESEEQATLEQWLKEDNSP